MPASGMRIGSDEQSDVILLDEGVPGRLLDLSQDDKGHLFCTWADSSLEFSYDGQVWSPAQAESLFSVNLHYRFRAVHWVFLRQISSEALAATHPHAIEPDISQALAAPAADRLLGRWRIALSRCTRLDWRDRRVQVCAAATLIAMSAIGASAWRGGSSGQAASSANDDPASGGRAISAGLRLSHELSLHHQAPAVPPANLFAAQPIAADDSAGIVTVAGQDVNENGNTLRLSSALSEAGKPVRAADKIAEPALFSLQERLDASAWGKRVVVHAIGNAITVRATLSESERRDFERIIGPLIREYGADVNFRALVDPLEPPVVLQVKQVLGGATPMVILEDGSRLTPGSVYEGKVVESITTQRIVLRGKDRIEIPI